MELGTVFLKNKIDKSSSRTSSLVIKNKKGPKYIKSEMKEKLYQHHRNTKGY